MSINKILVHTQYYENYGFHEGNFHWKKKGGHTFQIEMDADLLMYTDPAEVFSKMVECQSNDLERFKYIDHEIQFQSPTLLGTQADYIAVNKSLEEGDPTDIQDFEEGLEDLNPIIGGVDFSDSLDQLNNLTIISPTNNSNK
jgi:hypothetical protein